MQEAWSDSKTQPRCARRSPAVARRSGRAGSLDSQTHCGNAGRPTADARRVRHVFTKQARCCPGSGICPHPCWWCQGGVPTSPGQPSPNSVPRVSSSQFYWHYSQPYWHYPQPPLHYSPLHLPNACAPCSMVRCRRRRLQHALPGVAPRGKHRRPPLMIAWHVQTTAIRGLLCLLLTSH